MPLGVPKVRFQLPNQQQPDWIDSAVCFQYLYNRLSRERILFLCSELNDEAANQLVALLIYLNAENYSKEFYLYINSPGGSLICGLAVYDVISYISSDVSTIVIGGAASSASLISGAGTKGKRIALPHARLMIHQPETQVFGQAIDIEKETQEILRLKDEITAIYSKLTGQPFDRLAKDMERDFFMSAFQARRYNLVDAVVQTVQDY
uniref:Clp protease proteolytic subunit n=1 Tax=Cephaleuros parasiticus TaxID=173370 RepID=UPI001EDE01CE|nr:Clp protease proteolytic subunit [Cephaleuros parasiticus]UIB39051.1 Clp protease proteolytic subunit [Cephaleuros parasiticus]